MGEIHRKVTRLYYFILGVAIVGFVTLPLISKTSFFVHKAGVDAEVGVKSPSDTHTSVSPGTTEPTQPPEQQEPTPSETPADTTPEEVIAPSSQPAVEPHDSSVYLKLQSFEVPAGKGTLHAILNWDYKATYKPQLVLIDANGIEATAAAYPGSTILTDRPAQTFIKNPITGVWTAYVKGDNIPDDLGAYYFIAAVDK